MKARRILRTAQISPLKRDRKTSSCGHRELNITLFHCLVLCSVLPYSAPQLWSSLRCQHFSGWGFQLVATRCGHLLCKEVPKTLCLGQGGVWLSLGSPCPCLGHLQPVPPYVCRCPWATATRITSASFLFPKWEGHLLLGDREKECKQQSLII